MGREHTRIGYWFSGFAFDHAIRAAAISQLPLADDDADFGNVAVLHLAHDQIQFAEAHIVAHVRAAAELAVHVLPQRPGTDPRGYRPTVHLHDFAQRGIALQPERAEETLLLRLLPGVGPHH